jgi:hypothetical protein
MAVPYGGEQWECNEPQRLQLCIYGIVGQDKNPSWEVTWTENWLGEYENCLINTQNEILLPFFYHWEVVEWFAFFQF